MNPVQLISRKRDGAELSTEEIGELIGGYVRGEVPDYQMSAWAMAVFLRGMTTAETAALTDSMLRSGVVFEWPAGGKPKVDKHSSGGIGDKVSIPLAPALAACGLEVPMIPAAGSALPAGRSTNLKRSPGYGPIFPSKKRSASAAKSAA